MAYIAQSDLEALLGPPVVLAIYDDFNLGTVNAAALTEDIGFACARVDAGLARVVPNVTFPLTQTPTPQMVKYAALLYLKAISFQRRPEYVRQYGDKPMTQANDFLESLLEAKAYLTDLIASPVPGNAGGIILSNGPRTISDNVDGTDNLGDF